MEGYGSVYHPFGVCRRCRSTFCSATLRSNSQQTRPASVAARDSCWDIEHGPRISVLGLGVRSGVKPRAYRVQSVSNPFRGSDKVYFNVNGTDVKVSGDLRMAESVDAAQSEDLANEVWHALHRRYYPCDLGVDLLSLLSHSSPPHSPMSFNREPD